MPQLSRRAFGAGLGFAAMATQVRAATCTYPQWADDLRRDLDAMAVELTATLKPWSGPETVFKPEDYGDTKGLATKAIQGAIDAAAVSGGTVRLSQGDYVSGTLDLKSNVRLEVAKGARLLGSLDLTDYPERMAKRPTVMDSNMGMNQSLIFAEGCENISLCGEGEIDGRGHNFKGDETIHGTPGRPFLIRVIDCRRIHIHGITLKDSPCWMQNYLNCDDLLVEHMTVENQANFNNDGIDIDGCRRVIVRDCFISSGDDAICFKGAAQRPGENILIERCKLYTSCNAVKYGTDSQSVLRNVLVRHCEIGGVSEAMRRIKTVDADSGFSWEMVDGGLAENLLAHDIHIVRARSPFFLRLENRGRVRPEQSKPGIGRLRRIVFDRITGEDNGSRGSYFLSVPEQPIEDVVLRNIRIGQRPSTAWLAEEQIPDLRGVYPDAHMIDAHWGGVGKDDLGKAIGGDAPAYGLWARNVSGLTLIDYKVVPTGPDPRPEIVAKTGVTRFCRG
ncbi:glycoside hydrolase family 28 protein [Asticcacaulis sp. AC460]|uniref:glycoside hydrolase family 28 protein n=1 Tax=Asticcacaulis sp. AC460 TaxID=1282360 RepID=UPI0009E06D4F|nr:glycosyl hydrolase family 28 protein [Asticcacaulis sp. AC460]